MRLETCTLLRPAQASNLSLSLIPTILASFSLWLPVSSSGEIILLLHSLTPTLLRGKAGIQCLTRVTRPSTPSPLRPHPPSLLSSFPAPATKNTGWSATRPASASELLQLRSPMPYHVILLMNHHAHCRFPLFLHDLVRMVPQWDLPNILLKSAPSQSLALAAFLPFSPQYL